jgi:hypothetical protein
MAQGGRLFRLARQRSAEFLGRTVHESPPSSVDGAGAPQQGVGLDWIQRLSIGTANFQALDGTTGADGLLVLAEAPEWWAYMSESNTSPHAGKLRAVGVRSSLPFDAHVPTDTDDAPGTVWLDSEPQAGAVVEVVLPPTGGVRFEWGEIPGADGAPLTDFFLHVRRSDGEHFPRWRTGFKTTPDARGHLFAPVGLGWEVYGELSTHHVVGALGRVKAPGPTVPGEVVTLHIEVDATHRDLVQLTGVAVADDGAPLGGPMRVRYELGPEGAPTISGRSLALDEEGRWRVQLPRTKLNSPLRLTHAAANERRATVPFDSAHIARVLDVGTVALRAVPPVVAPPAPVPTPLARGRVVDTEGAPVKSAEVSVWGRAHSLKGAGTSAKDLALLASAYTKKDGSYELAAVTELAPGALRIGARHHEFLDTTTRKCDPGATDIDFVLTRGAQVSVRLQVEPMLVLSELIRPRLKGPNGRQGPVSRGEGERGRDRAPDEFPVRFTGLPDGELTLVIDVGQSHLPLVELEVAVHGDTDLGTIDLRGKLGIGYLRLSNATGERVDTRHFDLRDAVTNEDVAHEAVRLEPGRVMLIAPSALCDFTLDCGEAGTAHVPRSLLRPIGEVEVPEFAPVTVR